MILACLIAASILGAEITYYLIHKRKWPAVRASSAPSLVFAVLIGFTNLPFVLGLQAAFFGATFVGMTDKSRLGWKRVLLASVVFALILYYLIPLVKGFGGGLGAAAFVSSAAIYTVDKIFRRAFL